MDNLKDSTTIGEEKHNSEVLVLMIAMNNRRTKRALKHTF